VPQSGQATQTGQVDPQAIASKVDPAVVDIDTLVASGGRTVRAAGTGMIVTSSGQVLTNNHVIQGATSIKVTLTSDGSTYPGSVIGADPAADVALVQIQGKSGLPTVTLADSSTVSIGQPVVAIGNALGQGGAPSVTDGTITALDQSITAGGEGGPPEQLSGLIQSDAPISPGDSGGPLVNSASQVIGMITAGTSGRSQRSVSRTGYAIPSSTATDVVNHLRAGGGSAPTPTPATATQTGYLGVEVSDLDPATASQLGLGVNSGALVGAVVPGSPAARAGITARSAITAVDGTAVASSADLGSALHGHTAGQSVKVTWVDGSGSHTATVTLVGSLP
jgi:S1-C subfamily serine protease